MDSDDDIDSSDNDGDGDNADEDEDEDDDDDEEEEKAEGEADADTDSREAGIGLAWIGDGAGGGAKSHCEVTAYCRVTVRVACTGEKFFKCPVQVIVREKEGGCEVGFSKRGFRCCVVLLSAKRTNNSRQKARARRQTHSAATRCGCLLKGTSDERQARAIQLKHETLEKSNTVDARTAFEDEHWRRRRRQSRRRRKRSRRRRRVDAAHVVARRRERAGARRHGRAVMW